MTEYDYSPEAYEQHLAKQARIARWVDNTNGYTPANPFHPLPGAHENGPPTSPGPYPLQSIPVPPPTPIYTYTSRSARRPKRHHRRPANPRPTALGLPLGGALYMGATQAQLAQPNMTTGPISPHNQWFPYTSPHFPSSATSAVHPPFASPTHSPGYPYNQQYSPPSDSSSHQPESPYRANSYTPYSSSSGRSLPVTYQNPNQPMVVPLSGGIFVVLPPGQQVQVISAKDYYGTERDRDTDSDYSKQSFFGGLGQGRK